MEENGERMTERQRLGPSCRGRGSSFVGPWSEGPISWPRILRVGPASRGGEVPSWAPGVRGQLIGSSFQELALHLREGRFHRWPLE